MSNKQSAWRSPWVIGWAGMLVVFVTANVVMLYLAGDSTHRLVVKDYYDRGQDYEKNMLKRLAKDPGWVMEIESPQFVNVDKPTSFAFRVNDKEGKPVVPDSVTFFVYRPSDARHDFSVPMVLMEPGLYQTEAMFPLKGVWDILVSVQSGEDEFNTHHRISAGVKYTGKL